VQRSTRRSGSGHSWDHAANAGDLRAYIGGVGAIEQQEVVTGEISQNVAGAAPRELPLLAMLRTELSKRAPRHRWCSPPQSRWKMQPLSLSHLSHLVSTSRIWDCLQTVVIICDCV
jgi:hypothetical protein